MTETIYDGNLTEALQDIRIKPGDRILLKGGTYTGDFSSSTSGAELGITIMSYPGEHAIIDGSLVVGGINITWKDVEICYTGWTTRRTEQTGSSPTDLPTTKNLSFAGYGNKLINCVVHDLITPGCLGAGVAAEVYGCVFYHNGWSAPDRGHGHGLYIQNNTPVKVISDCVLFDNFGWGIHAYTEGGTINNITLNNVMSFKNGSLYDTSYSNILLGGYVIAQNPVISGCMTYGLSGAELGYVAGANNCLIADNYFTAGLDGTNCTNVTEIGNYYGPEVGNQVFLKPNSYDTSRANLAIFNQALSNSIVVNLSSLGWTGQVRARNVQDYWNDIQTLTISGGNITISMTDRTVSTPVAWTAPVSTFPMFGCFVLEKI